MEIKMTIIENEVNVVKEFTSEEQAIEFLVERVRAAGRVTDETDNSIPATVNPGDLPEDDVKEEHINE